jgi:putative FmdB family regulatory protein
VGVFLAKNPMPLYEYVCRSCERSFERYVRAWGDAVTCEACQSEDVEKRLSTFAMAGLASSSPAPSRGGGCCGGGGCGCGR